MGQSDFQFIIEGIFDDIAIGMALLDADGRFIKVNSALQQMLGYTKEELLNLNYSSITFPEDLPLSTYLFKDLFARNRQQYKIEKRYLKKNGQVIWVYKTNSIIHDGEGILKYAIMTVEDISRRKEMEEALIAEKKRLAITLDSIGDGVITTDTLGNIIMLNKTAEDITGWTQIEAIDEPIDKIFYLINDRTSEPFGNPIDHILKNGRTNFGLNENIVLVARDGDERFISATGTPIRNANGENIGVVLIFRDITERKKLDQIGRAHV